MFLEEISRGPLARVPLESVLDKWNWKAAILGRH